MARIVSAPQLARSTPRRSVSLVSLLATAAMGICLAMPAWALADTVPAGANFEVVPANQYDRVPVGDGRFVVVWPKVLDGGSVTIRSSFFDDAGVGRTTTSPPPPATTAVVITTSTLLATSTTAIMDTTTSTLFEVRPRPCGDPQPPDGITVVDALVILKAAVGDGSCELCVCDVDSSGTISAADALRVLRIAVGLPNQLNCPPCA